MKNFAELADPLVSLTRKGVPFVWGSDQQRAFDARKACLLSAPILGFPTEDTVCVGHGRKLVRHRRCSESNPK